MLTEAILRKMWPNGDTRIPGLVAGIAAAAPAVFKKYGIGNDTVIAQMMAQFSHECGAGLEMTENIKYTAERAAQVWPTRFASAADCYKKIGSWSGDPDFPGKLIDSVYGGRMGNRPGTQDGRAFIGRGLSQVTGRSGYMELQIKTGLPLLDSPNTVNQPVHALECGVADFIICGCLPFAQKDDVLGVTKRLNGGTIGLDARRVWLGQWKTALVGSPPVPAPDPVSVPEKSAVPASPAQKPIIQPKHATGLAAVIAALAAATQFETPLAIGVVIALGVGTAVLLHFVWKTKPLGG